MQPIVSNRYKGSVLGLTSGVFWGLNSVLLGLVLIIPKLINLGSNASLLITLIHDGISFVILFGILFYFRQIKSFLSILFSISGFKIILAALLGGPVGMGAYILAINNLGPSVAASGSAIYPAVGALLAFVFLRRKMKVHSILGFAIAITAISVMSIGSIESSSGNVIGILFLILCVLGWGSEAVIIDATLTESVPFYIALAIRQMTTFAVYSVVLIPIFKFKAVIDLVINPRIIILVTAASIAGTLSYLAYYKSIELIGSTQAMGLNISYPAWAFLFQFLIDGSFNFTSFILVILIIFGSILSSDDPKDLLNLFKQNE